MENAMQPPPPPPAFDMPQSSNTEQTVTHELTFVDWHVLHVKIIDGFNRRLLNHPIYFLRVPGNPRFARQYYNATL
ncbi:uncharacterized protein LOC114938838 isoform X2 [Nylanderia fulva]|uniref:uncharacterized protein LOC114938838 isoform X2 n=1 Tax=Nylanderia fulva TaxID=613905 RepID=UPI0010FB7F37|nr:uncharacterized protein LOC114938838 isoform X2 [Nylanderia fulva]